MTQPRHWFSRPPGAVDVLLVRHGHPAPDDPGSGVPLVDGQVDPSLDDLGRRQAARVALHLSGASAAAIYVSSRRRTAETAAPLAAQLGLTPVMEPDLREVHLGDWDGGVYRLRMAEGDPLVDRVAAEQRWDVLPGAEPASLFAARVRAAFAAIAAGHPDGTVVVVTHGGVIGELLAQISGASRRLFFSAADNASISHVVLGADGGQIRTFNDTSHLDGI